MFDPYVGIKTGKIEELKFSAVVIKDIHSYINYNYILIYMTMWVVFWGIKSDKLQIHKNVNIRNVP